MNNPETTGNETSSNDSIGALDKDIEPLPDTNSVEGSGTSDNDDRSTTNSVTLNKEA